MKADATNVDPGDLARRRRLGLDKFDEVWEGVLHVTPAPSYEHQRIKTELVAFLSGVCQRARHGRVVVELNVFHADDDYRIPDICFIATGHESIIAKDGLRGSPDVVIEIRSASDETHAKLTFYASLGVREVVVIDCDTKNPEVFRLAGRTYRTSSAGREGWVESEILGVHFRAEASFLAVMDDRQPEAIVRI